MSTPVHRQFGRVILPYLNNLLYIVLGVRLGADDEHSVQQVHGETMWTRKFRSPDSARPSVGGHDHERRQLVLQGPIQECEALDVEHVDLVNK